MCTTIVRCTVYTTGNVLFMRSGLVEIQLNSKKIKSETYQWDRDALVVASDKMHLNCDVLVAAVAVELNADVLNRVAVADTDVDNDMVTHIRVVAVQAVASAVSQMMTTGHPFEHHADLNNFQNNQKKNNRNR